MATRATVTSRNRSWAIEVVAKGRERGKVEKWKRVTEVS